MGRKCGLWPHADKTGGAVLFAPRFPRQENGRVFCDREEAKSLSVFRERRQVYKPPSPV